MRRALTTIITLFVSVVSVPSAETQASTPLHLPWDVPTAVAAEQLEQAGFRRRPSDSFRYVRAAGGQFQRVAADTSVTTYLRNAGGVSETVFMRRVGGQTVQMVYSAVGDSAALQARLDAVGADAVTRLGPGRRVGGLRVWDAANGGRYNVPAAPYPLPDTRRQFVVLFYRP